MATEVQDESFTFFTELGNENQTSPHNESPHKNNTLFMSGGLVEITTV